METSSSVGLRHLVELLYSFSTMTDCEHRVFKTLPSTASRYLSLNLCLYTLVNFTSIVKPSELPLLYQHAVTHGVGQSVRGLLLSVMRESKVF